MPKKNQKSANNVRIFLDGMSRAKARLYQERQSAFGESLRCARHGSIPLRLSLTK